jgi:hypothetical protein
LILTSAIKKRLRHSREKKWAKKSAAFFYLLPEPKRSANAICVNYLTQAHAHSD